MPRNTEEMYSMIWEGELEVGQETVCAHGQPRGNSVSYGISLIGDVVVDLYLLLLRATSNNNFFVVESVAFSDLCSSLISPCSCWGNWRLDSTIQVHLTADPTLGLPLAPAITSQVM